MKYFIFLWLLGATAAMAQTPPTLTDTGVEAVVTQTPNLTAQELYTKTKAWVNHYFHDAKEVTQADQPNTLLRLDGFTPGFYNIKSITTTYYDLSYTIEFAFKDGRYKMDFYPNQASNKGQPLLFSIDSFFKKKDGTVKKTYKTAVASFNESLNSLYLSHYNYVTGNTPNKDW